MPLNLPTSSKEIFQRLAGDVQANLPTANPLLRNSYLRALELGFSGSIYEFYLALQDAVNQIFFDTAEDEFLERWAAIFGITRNPATKATGFITVPGTDGASLPLNTLYNNSEGSEYLTNSSETIFQTSILGIIITRVGTTATVTTTSDHLLAPNIEVVISGATEPEYNGTFIIETVPAANQFTYTVSGSPVTPATGTPLATATFASVEVTSVDFGADQNAETGSKVTLSAPVLGVNNDAYVAFNEIAGGADLETNEELRERFLFRVQNPVALFNVAAIINQALTVPGVTRVFVRNVDNLQNTLNVSSITRNSQIATFITATPHGLEDGQIMEILGANESEYNVEAKIIVIDTTTGAYVVSGSPTSPATGTITMNVSISSPGQVRIFFVRDNDGTGTAILPTATEVTAVKDAILEIKPAHVSDSDVIVQAPVANTVNIVFSGLDPNTQDMQNAITANLRQFFAESTTVGEDVLLSRINAVIAGSIDSAGNNVKSFSLSSPATDVTIAANELAILGSITY